jgi:hypothetical protein
MKVQRSLRSREWNFHAGGAAQVVECLPSKFEALSSNPQYIERERTKFSNVLCYFRHFI